MTIVCSVLYKYFGMSWFDAVCHAFSTISIGGFSTHDESFSFFKESSLRWTAVVFMLIAGINFALHYIAWTKKRLLHYLYDTEVKFYLSIILVVFSLTSIALYRSGIYADQNTNILEESAFQVVSIATTTGFLTSDYSSWPLFVPFLLLSAAFIGACAGSTGGGIKVIRAAILLRQGTGEITKLIHPNAVVAIKLGSRPINSRVAESVWGFFSIYVIVFIILLMFLLSQNNDFITSFSAVGATLNNLGPGLGGVAENYKDLNDLSKLGLCMAMLLGRLEIFTLLVVFTPSFWRN
jgi:trk system potassium uptake protein TrkH